VLRKLGTLIQRNPRTTFLIEGHTDSFGSPEYNLGLSERRALAVKSWLVEEMGIEPSRIRTKGLGSTRLVAPASESIEGQRLNRRVEIVLEVDG
jgi:OOP family OmpA-OmpF porin